MENQRKEQKIFYRYHRTVEVCGKCDGEGKILVWPEGDLWKREEPKVEVCPLCEGSGMLRKTVTITTDLTPFKRE
jgi:DnaJ-class molecular chaperone